MIIWGFRTYGHVLGIVTFVCGRCGNPAAHRIVKYVRKFTLFFIPLFPISTRYVSTCTYCGLANQITAEQAQAAVATAGPSAPPVGQNPSVPGQPPQPYVQPAQQQYSAQQPDPGAPPAQH